MRKNYWEYFKTTLKHKRYVGRECFRVGLYWQGIMHDMSKFGKTEFVRNAKFFCGKYSPHDNERITAWYSLSRLHHKGHNPHHRSYWIDIDHSTWKAQPIAMPEKYILEMCCDFIGAGKVYNKEKFNNTEPLIYWKEKINKDLIHPDTVVKVTAYLEHYALYWTLK